jgi:hypothetical protein
VRNPIAINKEFIFPCKSSKLKKFLVESKGLSFVSRILDVKDNKYIWMFTKTDELSDALIEWKENKESGNLAFENKDNGTK